MLFKNEKKCDVGLITPFKLNFLFYYFLNYNEILL